MTIVSTTPYPPSRLQFNGETDDLGVKFVVMSLWPNIELARWQLTEDETQAFPVTVGLRLTASVENPGDETTLWTDGTDLYFGDTVLT